jgi:cytochrome c oxidase assembly factor CtaG
VILSLGLSLVLGGLLLWIPKRTPPAVRGFLFLVALALVTVVCNWTAFAPNMLDSSSTSIGPLSIAGEAGIAGRIAFGLAALVVDIFFIVTLIAWLRSTLRGE